MKKLNKSTARVFLVEDDPMFCAMMERALNNAGYKNITCFESGEAVAVELLTMPDIVILDHNLSGNMHGLEVLKKIKSLNPDIHVLFISAQEEMNIALQALKFGAFDYVIKDETALTETVKHIEKIVAVHNRSSHILSGMPWLNIALPLIVAIASVLAAALS